MTLKLLLQNKDIQKVGVCSLSFVLLVLFVAYVYLVSSSVLHVVMRKEVERQMSSLQAEVSRLEAQYISSQHSVSDHISSLDGYVEASDKIYINRTEVTAVALSSSE